MIDGYKHWLQHNKREWQDTTMNWEIAAVDSGTEISFMHIGLVPGIAYYDACESAWNFYIKESLFKSLTTAKGVPELK